MILRWIEGGKRLLFTSERDGWRHLYAISRDGDARLITSAPFDMVSLAAVDEPGGWAYYIASPDNATQRYLYRALPAQDRFKPNLSPRARPLVQGCIISHISVSRGVLGDLSNVKSRVDLPFKRLLPSNPLLAGSLHDL